MSSNFKKGALMTTLAAIFWGASGVFGQYIFQVANFPVMYVTTLRLLLSSIFFFLMVFLKNGRKELIEVWKNKNDAIVLIIYSVLGVLLVQLTYFMAISNSNAATATILQYIFPALIMIYIAVSTKKFPGKMEVISIILALLGIFLISTHGNINTLSISGVAFAWGIASAFAMMTNTLIPNKLIKKYGSPIIMSWAMLIGGMIMGIYSKAWTVSVVWDFNAVLVILGVVIIGTVAAFFCFFEGVKLIGPSKASLFASLEPIMATIFTVLLMNTKFVLMDYLGLACITAMLIIVAFSGDNNK